MTIMQLIAIKYFNQLTESHQWTFLVNTDYIFHTFLILANSNFYMIKSLKGTDCIQKSFDCILILPDKKYLSWALLCLQSLPRKPLNFWCSKSTSYWQRMNVHFNNPFWSFCSEQCEKIHQHKPGLNNIIIYTSDSSLFLKNGLTVQLRGL